MVKDKSKRLSVTDIMNHPWLNYQTFENKELAMDQSYFHVNPFQNKNTKPINPFASKSHNRKISRKSDNEICKTPGKESLTGENTTSNKNSVNFRKPTVDTLKDKERVILLEDAIHETPNENDEEKVAKPEKIKKLKSKNKHAKDRPSLYSAFSNMSKDLTIDNQDDNNNIFDKVLDQVQKNNTRKKKPKNTHNTDDNPQQDNFSLSYKNKTSMVKPIRDKVMNQEDNYRAKQKNLSRSLAEFSKEAEQSSKIYKDKKCDTNRSGSGHQKDTNIRFHENLILDNEEEVDNINQKSRTFKTKTKNNNTNLTIGKDIVSADNFDMIDKYRASKNSNKLQNTTNSLNRIGNSETRYQTKLSQVPGNQEDIERFSSKKYEKYESKYNESKDSYSPNTNLKKLGNYKINLDFLDSMQKDDCIIKEVDRTNEKVALRKHEKNKQDKGKLNRSGFGNDPNKSLIQSRTKNKRRELQKTGNSMLNDNEDEDENYADYTAKDERILTESNMNMIEKSSICYPNFEYEDLALEILEKVQSDQTQLKNPKKESSSFFSFFRKLNPFNCGVED